MAETNPARHRLSAPLREVARKDRRALLGLSMIALFMSATGAAPSTFSTLGVTLSAGDQRWFFFLFALVLAYLLLTFRFYARMDINDWKIAAEETVLNTQKYDNDLEIANRELRLREDQLRKAQEAAHQLRDVVGKSFAKPELQKKKDKRPELQREVGSHKRKVELLEKSKALALPPDIKLPLGLSRSIIFVEYYLPLAVGTLAIVSLFLGGIIRAFPA